MFPPFPAGYQLGLISDFMPFGCGLIALYYDEQLSSQEGARLIIE
jgi:hypothetical protein